MNRVQNVCELCEAAGLPLSADLLDYAPGGNLPIADGWVELVLVLPTLTLPKQYDGMAEVMSNVPGGGAYMASAAEPFQTSMHICPMHRKTATFAQLDVILMRRFRERDEIDPEEAPPEPREPSAPIPMRRPKPQ